MPRIIGASCEVPMTMPYAVAVAWLAGSSSANARPHTADRAAHAGRRMLDALLDRRPPLAGQAADVEPTGRDQPIDERRPDRPDDDRAVRRVVDHGRLDPGDRLDVGGQVADDANHA